MKTSIYYFTGTGNSLSIAKDLSNELKNSEIISISKSLIEKRFITNSDCVGFAFPNYYGKIPKLVKKFLYEVKLENSGYIFTVVTGGGTSGNTYNELKKILKDKGKKLNSFCEVILPGNYIIAPYYTVTNRTDDEKKILFKNSKNKILEISKKINKKEDFVELGGPVIRIISMILNIPNNLSKKEKWDKNFHSEDICISCGTCEKICPVNNIRLLDGKPTWHHNCQICLSCIHNCPKEAIQYKNKTKEKVRYRHPDVSLKELING